MELATLLSVILVAKEGRSPAVWAALRYLLLAGVGMILYLFGLGLVYGRTGLLAVSALAHADFSIPSIRIGVGFLLVGAAVKTGVFLLGLWLPPAHGQAPTEVSALLSGLVVKLGVMTMARLAEAFPVEPIVLALGILTGFGGLIYAIWEQDLKVFLAYSTVSQLGYMLLGLGLENQEAGLFYAVAHGLFKGLLFLSAGSAIEGAGKRKISELRGGLPWPAVLGLALGAWAIAGLPPLAGFPGKYALALSSPIWAKGILLGLSLGTAASFSKLLPILQPKNGDQAGGIFLLTAAILGLGIWGIFLFPGLWRLNPWLEAVLPAGAGYGVYLVLRKVPAKIPRLPLDWAILSALLTSLFLIAVVLFA
ncbi:MAG: complex I subunit 5 family protein [Candidatus Bipolaricaulaceae bacterium]